MEHNDLLEDVLLAVLVATTTVATLLVGWRTGQTARRPGDGSSPQPTPLDPTADAEWTAPRRESLGAWTLRLVSEQARSARTGSPATVVAVRLGKDRGPLARRGEPELGRTVAVADRIAAQARASDVVRVTDDGIIRILLAETPDDGARVFVDRISAGLAAQPSAAGRDVVAAWASIAPSRHLPAADRLAVARLRGATSGWLRSLAVRRTAENATTTAFTPDGGGATEHEGSVG